MTNNVVSNVSTEQIEETRLLHKESQSKITLLKGIDIMYNITITNEQLEEYTYDGKLLNIIEKRKQVTG